MALATAVGVNGSLTFITGHNLKFDRWALTIGQALLNTTGFGETFEVNTAGLKSGRFSASGHMNYGSTNTAPGMGSLSQTGGTATFQVATGCTQAATCIIGQVAMTTDVNNEARATFSGVTSGAITETWAVS